jgi:hypothetical protein
VQEDFVSSLIARKGNRKLTHGGNRKLTLLYDKMYFSSHLNEEEPILPMGTEGARRAAVVPVG